MKLSIIIPVYNVEKYLEECIESIFLQNLSESDFEVILINDGSTDNSQNICEKIVKEKSNVSLYNQINKGQSSARNLGIQKSQGEYILFVDSDDYLKPFYLKSLLKVIEDKSLDFIGFGYELTRSRFDRSLTFSDLGIVLEGGGINILERYNYNNGPCWYIFKKSILGKLVFDEGRLCEDGIFTAQLIMKVNNGVILKNKIYCYFNNEESTVKTDNKERIDKLNNDMFYAAIRFNDIIKKLPENYNGKAYWRLKHRQESYTFFAIIRFIKRKRKFKELKPILNNLSQNDYPAYPILVFDGYENKKNKILIKIFNNKFLLRTLITLNRIFNFIK